MHLYDLLQNREIIPHVEAKRINQLLHKEIEYEEYITTVFASLYEEIDSNFHFLPIQSTFVTFSEVLDELRLSSIDETWDFPKLTLYYELILTILNYLCDNHKIRSMLEETFNKIICNIKIVLEKTNHEIHFNKENQFAFIVEKNKFATEAIENIEDEQLAFELIDYNRALFKGRVEEKRKILRSLANHIEPILKSKKLDSTAYSALKKDIGFYLNNFNIRHNNVEGKEKRNYLVSMTEQELENWYDDIYTSILMLIIADKQIDRDKKLSEFKKHNSL